MRRLVAIAMAFTFVQAAAADHGSHVEYAEYVSTLLRTVSKTLDPGDTAIAVRGLAADMLELARRGKVLPREWE